MAPQIRAFNDVALAMFCGYYDNIVAKNSPPATGDELFAKLQDLIYHHDPCGSTKMELCNMPAEEAPQSPSEGTRDQERPIKLGSQSTAIICGSDLFKKYPLKHTSNVLNDDGKQEEAIKAVDLPYLSCVDYGSTCQALKVNGGLLSPCLTRPAKGSTYCKTCLKSDLKYGTIADRENTSLMCYQDPKGKKEISFGTYCAKRSIPPEAMKAQISDLYNGLVLPEEQWLVDKTKASRPIKSSSSSSSDGDKAAVDPDAPKKKRGRPKKVIKVVEDVTTNDVSEPAEDTSNEVKVEAPKKTKKPKKPKKTAQVEVSSDGELEEEEPVAEEPGAEEPVAEEPVAKEPIAEEPIAEEPIAEEPIAEEPIAEEPVAEEPVAKEPVHEQPVAEEADGSNSENEEEEWQKIVYKGISFLVDEEQTLWFETDDDAEPIGTWDPNTKTPTFSDGFDIAALKADP